MDRLRERRRRLLGKLPPLENVLRGSLVERAVRCGKASCRCAAGELHQATYLSVTHRGGRTEQISIPSDLVGTVRHGLAVYSQWWDILEQIASINRDLLRQQRAKRRGGADGAGQSAVGDKRSKRRG